jgi:hypothetical protein
MMRIFFIIRTALLGVALAAGPALAGQDCPEKPARNESLDGILRLASSVRDKLETSGASIAYIARAGIDLREYGLVYSHLGLAWRDHPKGRWFTFHLLNPCQTSESELADHSLEDFYKVELFTYDALVAIPSQAVQHRLLKAFFSPLAATLHHRIYNMVSYPFSTRYQNSNQWVLEVSAAALGPENLIQNRHQAQNWLRQNGYEPSRAYISKMRRWGALALSPHIHFDDHTAEEERINTYMVVTVESIIKLIEKSDAGMKVHRLSLDGVRP